MLRFSWLKLASFSAVTSGVATAHKGLGPARTGRTRLWRKHALSGTTSRDTLVCRISPER